MVCICNAANASLPEFLALREFVNIHNSQLLMAVNILILESYAALIFISCNVTKDSCVV